MWTCYMCILCGHLKCTFYKFIFCVHVKCAFYYLYPSLRFPSLRFPINSTTPPHLHPPPNRTHYDFWSRTLTSTFEASSQVVSSLMFFAVVCTLLVFCPLSLFLSFLVFCLRFSAFALYFLLLPFLVFSCLFSSLLLSHLLCSSYCFSSLLCFYFHVQLLFYVHFLCTLYMWIIQVHVLRTIFMYMFYVHFLWTFYMYIICVHFFWILYKHICCVHYICTC